MTRCRWVEVTLLIAVVSMMMGCQSDSVDAQAAGAPATVTVTDPLSICGRAMVRRSVTSDTLVRASM